MGNKQKPRHWNAERMNRLEARVERIELAVDMPRDGDSDQRTGIQKTQDAIVAVLRSFGAQIDSWLPR